MSNSPQSLTNLAARVAELEAERELTLQFAQTDALTGLVNRGAFTTGLIESIEKAQENDGSVALFIIDLDRFKVLNDTLGHHAGDQLLAELGQRLRDEARPGDLVARLGGDEFALITSDHDISVRAQRLISLLSLPQTIYGRTVVPGGSVGVAVYPRDAHDIVDLQRFADMALYRAKTLGGRRFSIFDAELRDESLRRRTLEDELRRAIPAGEIDVPLVQPAANERLPVR